MKTDCNEYLKISKKLTYFDHYQALPQKDLPEIESMKENPVVFIFLKSVSN